MLHELNAAGAKLCETLPKRVNEMPLKLPLNNIAEETIRLSVLLVAFGLRSLEFTDSFCAPDPPRVPARHH